MDDSSVKTALPWWERSGRLVLAFWFFLPALVFPVAIALKYLRGDYKQALSPALSIGMSLVYLLAGSMAAAGKLILAVILLAVDLSLDVAALGGFLPGSPSEMGGTTRSLLSLVFSAAGLTWVLGLRYLKDQKIHKVLAVALFIALGVRLPELASRLGSALGDTLAPAPVSRIAEAGERLPELRLADLSGAVVPLDEPGKLYVVNFWATWCRPCRVELPHLLDMIEALPQNAPVRLMAVNTEGLGREAVEAFLQKEGLLGLAVFTDPSGSMQLLETGTIPLTVVIRNRTLLTRYVGYSPDTIQRLRAEILSYLEAGGTDPPAAPPS